LVAISSAIAETPVGTVTNTVQLVVPPAGLGEPFDMKLSPDGKTVWIATNHLAPNSIIGGSIVLMDVGSEALTGNFIEAGGSPYSIFFSNPEGALFVAGGYFLSILDTTSLSEVQDITLGPSLGSATLIYANGRLLLSTNEGLLEYQASNNASDPIVYQKNIPLEGDTPPFAGEAYFMTVLPDKARGYWRKDAHNSGHDRLDGDLVLVPVISPTSSSTFLPFLEIVDVQAGKVLASVTEHASTYPDEVVFAFHAAASPDGREAYASLVDDGQHSPDNAGVWVVDLRTMKTKTIIRTGEYYNAAIALSTDGKYLLVAETSLNQVALIDTQSETVIQQIPVGIEPFSMVLSEDNSKAFVGNLGGDVSVISFKPSL
jgi:YVTN family beta-propeller protein